MRRWAPEVAFVHGLRSSQLEREILDMCPSVMFAHGYYGTCATGTKLHLQPELEACARTLEPACLILNYTRRCGMRNPRSLFLNYLLQSQRSQMLKRYQSVLVASSHMREEYARAGLDETRLRVAPYPVAAPQVTVSEFDESPSPESLLFVGRITELKGLPFLIEAIPLAARRLGRRLSLTVAGDGPLRQHAESMAACTDANVRFVGWLRGDEVESLMRTADLLVVPSVWPEPFGMVGVEGGRVGLPSVAFDVGGVRDWLEPGVSGELAAGNPPTAAGLADAIVRALVNPSSHRGLRAGALSVSRRFTMDAHLRVLAEALGRANVQSATPSR